MGLEVEKPLKLRLPVELEIDVYDILMKDYKECNDEPKYSFEDYLSDVLFEESQHIQITGHRRIPTDRCNNCND